jgi:uncharacterized protein YcbX
VGSVGSVGTVGTVAELHRYPLKSAAGERLDAAEVTASGLAGDRRWVLTTEQGSSVTGKEAPGLARVAAALDADDLAITVPDGPPLRGHEARAALAEAVGEPVRWESATVDTARAPVHLVSRGAAQAPDATSGCDPDPRANLVLALNAGPGTERGWVGHRLRIGSVELQVSRTPRRCLGVYAEVLVPGTVSVGDGVQLLLED